MTVTWTPLIHKSETNSMGPIEFRSSGDKIQRRVFERIGEYYTPVTLDEYLEDIRDLTEGLEEITLVSEDADILGRCNTLISGWSDDLAGYSPEDLIPSSHYNL